MVSRAWVELAAFGVVLVMTLNKDCISPSFDLEHCSEVGSGAERIFPRDLPALFTPA